jgi:hypothetical protein
MKTYIERLNSLPGRVARLYNEWFVVPVMMYNKSGAWNSLAPDSTLGIPENFRFSGRSTILDADQTVRGELGDHGGRPKRRMGHERQAAIRPRSTGNVSAVYPNAVE